MKIIKKLYRVFILLFIKIRNKGNISIGNNFCFRRGININVRDSGELIIGNNVFINNYCSINCRERIVIGDNTIFGEGVKIYDHDHKYRDPNILIKDQGFANKEITIGNNCWIGSNSVILKGASIGDNCVIGAACIIRGQIPNNHIVFHQNSLTIKEIGT